MKAHHTVNTAFSRRSSEEMLLVTQMAALEVVQDVAATSTTDANTSRFIEVT
jgi:hypothetical protein